MSTNHNKKKRSGPQNGGDRSVRFAPQVMDDNHDEGGGGPRRKRPRMDRPNEDEQDDVDDWSDDEEHVGASTKELLEAKRKRRLQRDHLDDGDDDDEQEEETHVDAQTSLAADTDQEDVAIEPFNMNAEQNDGSGYFDGDTYVFRKRDEDEEPDAWVDSIDEQKLPAVADSALNEKEQEDDENNMDKWNREDLYAKLVPLLSDTESVLQALVRFGALLKRKTDKDDEKQKAATAVAQHALDTLTEASNALLLKGDVDIYQKTRNDLVKMLPKGPVVTWEYKGNQDGQIHGPYTTEQMKSWTGAGYFIGDQAVQIRTVSASSKADEKKDEKPTVDDLLSDLMDDDDDDDEARDKKKDAQQQVKGEWMSSNDVDFNAYS